MVVELTVFRGLVDSWTTLNPFACLLTWVPFMCNASSGSCKTCDRLNRHHPGNFVANCRETLAKPLSSPSHQMSCFMAMAMASYTI